MSEIPFYFPSPTPRYFRDNGFFKDPKNKAFVDWCFERCSPEERTICHDNQQITLKPYQFIFGRFICSEETGLTDNEIRTQQKRWEKSGLLTNITKNITKKTTKRFTVYEWSIARFSKNNNQVKHQETTKRQPRDNHNQELKNCRSKESHQPQTPSSPDLIISPALTDDFSFSLKKEEWNKQVTTKQEGNADGQYFKQAGSVAVSSLPVNPEEPSVEVIPGIFIKQSVLDKCVQIKGSLQLVQDAMKYIQNCPSRKAEIRDWPNALQTWTIKVDVASMAIEHERLAIKNEEKYNIFQNGWKGSCYHDKNRDQKGFLFECSNSYVAPVFYAYADSEFLKKVSKFIETNMLGIKR